MEFKGTKGRWVMGNCFLNDHEGNWKAIYIKEDCEKDPFKFEMVTLISQLEKLTKTDLYNAELIVEAGNVRQQIDCSLTELLEKYNEAMKSLKKLTSESLKTKQHHNLPSFKKAIDDAELLIKKQ